MLIYRSFEIGEEPLVYKDALGLTQAEWENLDPKVIAVLQQERYAGWKAIIDSAALAEAQDDKATDAALADVAIAKATNLDQWITAEAIDKAALIKGLADVSSLPVDGIAAVAADVTVAPSPVIRAKL